MTTLSFSIYPPTPADAEQLALDRALAYLGVDELPADAVLAVTEVRADQYFNNGTVASWIADVDVHVVSGLKIRYVSE